MGTYMVFQEFKSDSSPQLSVPANYQHSGNGDELTLVTAYFNIGSFNKTPNLIFSKNTYNNWMKNFQYVNNCVILYTDDIDLSLDFRLYRSHFPMNLTKVFILKQTSLWAFSLLPRIKEIYDQKGYPNPGIPAYSSAMHAKYELVEKVINENILSTSYLAWIDIGYLRSNTSDSFVIKPLTSMKDGHISFSQVDFFKPRLTLKKIMYQSRFYIAGGLFIGKPEYLSVFIEDYKLAVETLLKMKLMNSDQQILFAMYSEKLFFLPRIPIQTFFDENILIKKKPERWFYLGKLCQKL
ncbi:protein HtrL-like [Mytilus galloprovincialis]|uniref:protein HtrL-like n=1 Tax=Mytilus galloprovincialis TaxID=29158 RepID=UPI003F7C1D43